jgi:hypothetical protein
LASALGSEDMGETKTVSKVVAGTSGNNLSAAWSGDETKINLSTYTSDPIPAKMNISAKALVTTGFQKAPAYLIDRQHHIDQIYGSVDNYLKHLGGGARTESAVHAYQKAADLESAQESYRIEVETQKVHK